MKRKHSISFMLAVLVLLGACTPADNTGTDQATVTAGNWRVSFFSERGNDETSDFSGYSFAFNNDGTITATKNGAGTNGTWSINSGSNRFNIDLGPKTDTNKPLGELTDDWVIVSISGTQIQLTDDNASSEEFLNFTKN